MLSLIRTGCVLSFCDRVMQNGVSDPPFFISHVNIGFQVFGLDKAFTDFTVLSLVILELLLLESGRSLFLLLNRIARLEDYLT